LTPVHELGQELYRSLRSAATRDHPTTTMDVATGLGLFAAGMALGVSLGLLFAPSSGRELREDLGHRIDGLRPSGESHPEQASAV
jgi:gas vesicle protein